MRASLPLLRVLVDICRVICRLGRRKQAPSALVKPRANRVPSQANRGFIDHSADLRLFAENGNPQHLSQSAAQTANAIQLLFRAS
jgi:hypothetical protein